MHGSESAIIGAIRGKKKIEMTGVGY